MEHLEFTRALQELSEDREHGASELARRCLALLAQSARTLSVRNGAELRRELFHRCDLLSAARPSMAPIQNLLTAWRIALQRLDTAAPTLLRAAAVEAAEAGIRRSQQAMLKAMDHCAAYIGPDRSILTHSLSATVQGVFERLKDHNVSAIVSESRPLDEGVLLARRLADVEIPVQLITDAQLGLFAAQADLALLGADSLLPDGSLVNKAGSYLLALAARDCGIPLYVCCESCKRRTVEMGEPRLEEMEGSELGARDLPGVRMRNIYFDITPARLIDRWIDETGVYDLESVQEIIVNGQG